MGREQLTVRAASRPDYYRIPTERAPDGKRRFGEREAVFRTTQTVSVSDRAEPGFRET